MIKHIHRDSNRTQRDTARLRADRDRYQNEKPTPEQLLAESGHKEFVSLGELQADQKLARAKRKMSAGARQQR